jgi:hypothetical protein
MNTTVPTNGQEHGGARNAEPSEEIAYLRV